MQTYKQPESITWVDSGLQIEKGWSAVSVFQSVAREWSGKVVTVGIPIYEDDEVVVLGLSYDPENDNFYGAQLIAKSCVQERTPLVAAA